MKLYKITALQQAAEQEEDAEIKHDLQELIATELKGKAQNIVMLIKNKEANIEAIDNEIKRLQQLKKRNNTQLEKIKEYTIYNLNKLGHKSVNTVLGQLNISVSTSTLIENIEHLPSKFVTVKQELIPDKTAIKKAIQAGEKVEGAVLLTNYNLQIK